MINGETSTSELLDLLGELMQLPAEQQTARLAALAIADADREKLQKWLRLRDGSESFLELPPSLVLRTVRPLLSGGRRITESGCGSECADSASLRSATPPSVGGYEVKELLGQGGMATVWRAVHAGTGREVALKVMEPLLLASPRARARFERELRLAARLRHPHIARVYDGGSTGSACYNVMELIDGVALDQFVESHGLSQQLIIALIIRVCQAVAHAHQNAVIHRDLKPSNILVDKTGEPHLLDFGLARALEEATSDPILSLTLDGDLAGTPAYMSPEQASGVGPLDTRTDVYSLGVILYRLLVGRPPHDLSGSRLEVLRRISQGPPLPPRTGPRHVDRLLEAILLRALARAPEDRYSSVADFAKDLSAYLNGEAVVASPPSGPERLRRFVRKNRVGLTIASAFAAVLVAATVVSTWQAVRATKFGAATLVERDRAVRAQEAEAAQRKAAEQARAETERINRLLSGMTASVDLRESLDLIKQTKRPADQPIGSADVLSELAAHMRRRGRVIEGEALSREALRQDQEAGNSASISAMYHWAHHAELLNDKGDFEGAEQYAAKALAEARREFRQPNRLLGYGIYYAASLLEEHGKYAQAEPLAREVQELRERHPEIDAAGGGDEAVSLCLAHIYSGLGRLEEAHDWHHHLRQILESQLPELTNQIRGAPYNAGDYAQRGVVYGRAGRFREAADDYASTVRLHPGEPYAWEQWMGALLGAANIDEYQKVRRQALAVSATSADAEMCADIARACLLEPAVGPDFAAAARLAERAAAVDPDSSWACFAQGLAQYRLGKYGPAVVWFTRSRRGLSWEDRREAMTELFTALALNRLGCEDAARSALRRGLRIVATSLQPAADGDLGYDGGGCGTDFQDMVFVRLAVQEAMAGFSLNEDSDKRQAGVDPLTTMRLPVPAWWRATQQRRIDVLNAWLSVRPGDSPSLEARGEVYAALGSFREAAADFAMALNTHPQEGRAARFGMPVFLICGDHKAFSQARSQAVHLLPSDPDGKLLTVCILLSPKEGSEVAAAITNADRLAAADPADAWGCLAKGLAELRRGNDADAVRWLTAADADESTPDWRRLACSRFFLALARSRLGNRQEASEDLDVGSALLQQKRLQPQQRDATDSALFDWVLCHCALNELDGGARK